MIWITDAGSSGAFGIVCACVGMAAASFFIYALHDWAEALAARAMGDKTVGLSFSYVGQMRSGFNIMSTVMLLLFGIGWKTHIKSDETRRARSIGTSLCGAAGVLCTGYNSIHYITGSVAAVCRIIDTDTPGRNIPAQGRV